MKRPAFQFYPADWRKDNELQACSIAARGLWHELMCLMHESEPYGHLTSNGAAMPDERAARLTGVELRDYRKLLRELEGAGVPSRTGDGVLYSRRMVRDEDARNRRAAGGEAGAEHGHKGAEHGAKGGRPTKGRGVIEPPSDGTQEGANKPPSEPPPSASTASSASASALISHAVERTPNEGARATGSHGRGEKARNGNPVESWSTPAWVTATAQTLGMQRRNGESDGDFADRVHTEVEARRRKAASDANRRAGH